MEVLGRRHRIARNKTTEFYSVDIEDGDGRKMVMNVWMDDFMRFDNEFTKGTLLRIEVKPPSGGYKTLSFYSPPRHRKHEIPVNKEEDFRVVVLPPGDLKEVPVDLTTLTME